MRLITAIGVIVILMGNTAPSISGEKSVVCYFVAWAVTRLRQGKFSADEAKGAHQCTHLIYAFMGVDEKTSKIKSIDENIDLSGYNQLEKLKNLKNFNQNLKISLSVGGYNEMGRKFSDLARDPNRRKTFINSTISLLRKYNLDGIDICWQFPGKNPGRGGRTEDKENSIILFSEIKEAFKDYNFLLSVHILGKKTNIDEYNIPKMADVVDFINLIPVEFSGPWERTTGIMSPLIPPKSDTTQESVQTTVDYMINEKNKFPPGKIMLGLALYGHAFVLDAPPSNGTYIGLYSDRTFQGHWTNQPGIVAYSESCKFFKDEKGWKHIWHKESCTPISYKEEKLISYDNERSFLLKADLINTRNLGGVMFWSLDMDDFQGLCTGKKFPMVSSISDFINGKRDSSLPTPTCDQEEGNSKVPPVTSANNQNAEVGQPCQSGIGFCSTVADCPGAEVYMASGWKPETCTSRSGAPLICCPSKPREDVTTEAETSTELKVPPIQGGKPLGQLQLHVYPNGEKKPIWPSSKWDSIWHQTWSVNYTWKTSNTKVQ